MLRDRRPGRFGRDRELHRALVWIGGEGSSLRRAMFYDTE